MIESAFNEIESSSFNKKVKVSETLSNCDDSPVDYKVDSSLEKIVEPENFMALLKHHLFAIILQLNAWKK